MEESKLHTFINHQDGFTLHILEGNKILSDLQNIHSVEEDTFRFFKNTILSSLHFINYLKGGENLGFYIDSETPYFRFKLELNAAGSFRTLFLPEEVPEIPDQLIGNCRLARIPVNREPYTSVISLNDILTKDIVNTLLEKSYQTHSKVLLDEKSPNSILIAKLPPTNVDKKVEDFENLTLQEYFLKNQLPIKDFFNFDVMDEKEINERMAEMGYSFLSSKKIHFYCPCSKERFVSNLYKIPLEERNSLFNEQGIIETRCDYCNKVYPITKQNFTS